MTQKKILFIDDDIRIESLCKRLLYDKKYIITVVSNGQLGIEKIKTIQPDIVFCDILMPGMNGYQVLDHVRGDETMRSTKFVFLTAKSTTEEFIEGMTKGADAYLMKPVTRDELIDVIDN